MNRTKCQKGHDGAGSWTLAHVCLRGPGIPTRDPHTPKSCHTPTNSGCPASDCRNIVWLPTRRLPRPASAGVLRPDPALPATELGSHRACSPQFFVHVPSPPFSPVWRLVLSFAICTYSTRWDSPCWGPCRGCGGQGVSRAPPLQARPTSL